MPDVKHFDPDAVIDACERLFWARGPHIGVNEIVAATGVSRSSLYATFGSKRGLYLASLRRYLDARSVPVFARLAATGGAAGIHEFFSRLISTRCSGEHARWGCMVTNTHATVEPGDVEVIALLTEHHRGLCDAFRDALATAELRPGVDPDDAAGRLALLAYGVNLRSRAGAAEDDLRATVTAALSSTFTLSPDH